MKDSPDRRNAPRHAPPALDAYGMSYPTVGRVLVGFERDDVIEEHLTWLQSRPKEPLHVASPAFNGGRVIEGYRRDAAIREHIEWLESRESALRDVETADTPIGRFAAGHRSLKVGRPRRSNQEATSEQSKGEICPG
jgi:hypothetical protein